MGGPSAHGQRNKGHKAGRHAGKSARDKHKLKKEGGSGPRTSIKSASHSNKLERAQASKQHRDAKRNELLEARRRHSAPVVVAFLPLSADVNPAPLLAGLLAAAGSPGTTAAAADGSLCTILAQGRRRVRLTLLPAPLDRDDPLAIVDLAKAAEVLLLLLPALPDPEQQEALVRENEPDPLDGEQTWPTEEELAAAAGGSKLRKRRLPAGTSEYQAAWILDDDEVSGSDDNDDEEEDDDAAMAEDAAAAGGAPSAVPLSEDLASEEDYGAAAGDEGDDDASMMGDDEEAEQAAAQRLREELKAKRMAEAEDAEYPDEIDTPQDMPARQRFAKYRGLKSFRSSPWDAREGLPAEYGRVFAFENFKRTAKRAHEAVARATDGSDPCCVLPGSWVTLVLADVPAAAAAAVLERTAAAAAAAAACAAAAAGDDGMSLDARGAVPLTVYGLLQHEAKLSVVNFSMKKAASYTETIRNKEELLLVCGLRSFTGQPVLSDDAQGADKNKMERFLHPGKTAVGSLYAPISFPPLPLLAFKVVPGQKPQLAATGALRSCDPDRLVVKKIVLSGYPVRVHKTRGVVRLMFFNPDDIRWFKPVELWTKSGRRGRITEPLGTHGAFKARFDGPVQQRDAVCMSLYKRVFPKWQAAAQQQGGLGMASFA
ncbi:hypothetical protein OEZ85_003006 [Tetradesmus obliquus]|uniref:Ribosome biogenesis protein BMS1/TSR1 C-terminal domain-containing protein n=1 Tax=Tetradesmus obliquus TaxID=3088 RepID=A0ABY8TZA1_TETOB|nr:hypothetical protein OEZ85_003006 [Tetradesmus obliquus]